MVRRWKRSAGSCRSRAARSPRASTGRRLPPRVGQRHICYTRTVETTEGLAWTHVGCTPTRSGPTTSRRVVAWVRHRCEHRRRVLAAEGGVALRHHPTRRDARDSVADGVVGSRPARPPRRQLFGQRPDGDVQRLLQDRLLAHQHLVWRRQRAGIADVKFAASALGYHAKRTPTAAYGILSPESEPT